jgi:hypothetical protein
MYLGVGAVTYSGTQYNKPESGNPEHSTPPCPPTNPTPTM